MSLLNSKFDIVSVDNPLAVAALAQVLEVDSPPALGANGTPTPGTIPPGAIVKMNSIGKAVLATTPALGTMATMPVLAFVTIDGNVDYSGAFVQKLTVFAGGYTMNTDQYNVVAYTPGGALTFDTGKVRPAVSGDQLFGFVGPAGLDSVEGVLQVIVPQGCGLSYLPTHSH
jgi:hypothetical protein